MSIAGGTINGPSYKPMFVVVVLRDISNRKQTEKALQESEKKCRTIFENASDGIMLVDIENKKFHMGNKTIHKMLGYTPKEIKNITIFDIHPKDEMPEILKQFERQLRKEITLAKDIPIKRKDGSIFYADINSTPIKLAGKDYLLGIFRDITERKQNEELLRQKEELNQSLLDSIPFYAMLISKDKTVLAANKISQKAGAKINGFCWRDFGQSEFIHEEDKEYIDKNKKIPPDGTNCYFCLA